MKKETKNIIIKDLNRIEKEYNLKYYIDIFADLEKTCYKLHEKISFNEIEKDLYKNYSLYSMLKESYKNIINQILRYILIDIVKLYIDTVTSKRDQTEFIKLLWDDENKKYIYIVFRFLLIMNAAVTKFLFLDIMILKIQLI